MRCYVRFLLGRLEEKLDQMNCILNDLTEIKTEFKNSSHEQRQLLNRMRVQADELDRLRKANVELALSNKKSEDRFRLFLLIIVSVGSSASVYLGPNCKGTTYKKAVVDTPIEHTCERFKFPAGTVILKMMKPKVRTLAI